MNIIDAYNAYLERYPSNTREDFANAVAGAAASDDPDYVLEWEKMNEWEQFTRGSRYGREERLLDCWREEVRRKWRAVYDRRRAEVLAELG